MTFRTWVSVTALLLFFSKAVCFFFSLRGHASSGDVGLLLGAFISSAAFRVQAPAISSQFIVKAKVG